jgi:hypothetical protein
MAPYRQYRAWPKEAAFLRSQGPQVLADAKTRLALLVTFALRARDPRVLALQASSLTRSTLLLFLLVSSAWEVRTVVSTAQVPHPPWQQQHPWFTNS